MLLIPRVSLLLQLSGPTVPTPQPPFPSSVIVRPVMTLPQIGLDDTAAYRGYQTRIFRDGAQNTLQIYVDRVAARVVHLWADAENESVGFTARGRDGKAALLAWDAPGATLAGGPRSRMRSVEYRLVAHDSVVHLGWFLLGTMRLERDFQYFRKQQEAFRNAPYTMEETGRLVSALEKVEPRERQELLKLLNAADVATLKARRIASITVRTTATRWMAKVTQPSFDGRDTLELEISVDRQSAGATRAGDSLSLRALRGRRVPFTVRVTTTGAPLTPLRRDEIFTADFLRFLREARTAATDSSSPQGQRARRLERQVVGVELLSSREKLMAGLPTYATYFGRDMLVSALMMRPIWRSAMSEAAIAAALRKLSPDGQVSHEEALGGQAVREAAAEFADLVDARLAATQRGDHETAASMQRRAATVLRDARRTRENYHMIDDELQLPVLVARWITDPNVSRVAKRAFLLGEGQRVADVPLSHLTLLVRELAMVARMTAPYSEKPDVLNLIAFSNRDGEGVTARWSSSSWRDSGVGYANGRFAMDVNAIWAPQALESIQRILPVLALLGFSIDSIAAREPVTAPLVRWTKNPAALSLAIERWRDAGSHFLVQLSPAAVRAGIGARLAAMPDDERRYWSARVSATSSDRDSLTFLALALDATGVPIPVVNTDPATRLFLGEHEGAAGPLAEADASRALRDVRVFTRPYPAGLLVGVGPVVANDAFALPAVWQAFAADPYHGPRVIWGREVNLFLLGAANHVQSAEQSRAPAALAFARELRDAITQVRGSVNASGFHSELWSYGFTNGRLVPMRYGSGADVQLWSTTDLAVEYALSRLGTSVGVRR